MVPGSSPDLSSQSDAAVIGTKKESGESESDFCRICHCGIEVDTLISPCKCSGTLGRCFLSIVICSGTLYYCLLSLAVVL